MMKQFIGALKQSRCKYNQINNTVMNDRTVNKLDEIL